MYTDTPLHLRVHADMNFKDGEGNNVTNYVKFRKLSKQVPNFIYSAMLSYCEGYIAARRGDLSLSSVKDIKEQVDDYLEDVQHRIIDRLDAATPKSIDNYMSMDFRVMVDSVNSLPVEERINQLIRQYAENSKTIS